MRRPGEDARGVRANRKKRGVTQVEQAGIADDDVQAQGQDHKNKHIGYIVDDSPIERLVHQWEGQEQKNQEGPGEDLALPIRQCSPGRFQ